MRIVHSSDEWPQGGRVELPWWWSVLVAPLLTALLATAGAWIAVTFDRRKTVNQELIRKRIAIYDQIAPKLNDLYCFCVSLGHWRALEPPGMINHKRDLDRAMYVYGPLFSAALFNRYQLFTQTLFQTFVAPGQPARLRVSRHQLQVMWGTDWDDDWDSFLVEHHEASDFSAIQSTYRDLMEQLAGEIGVSGRLHRPNKSAGRRVFWPFSG